MPIAMGSGRRQDSDLEECKNAVLDFKLHAKCTCVLDLARTVFIEVRSLHLQKSQAAWVTDLAEAQASIVYRTSNAC